MTNKINWGLDDNTGIGFNKILEQQNKLIIGEANLMLILSDLMNTLNNKLSGASNKLKDVSDNLNWLNWMDVSTSTMMTLSIMAGFGLMGLSSIAIVADAEELENASFLTKKVLAPNNKIAQLIGSSKGQLLLKGVQGTVGAGIVMSILQSFFTQNTGIDRSKIQKLKAFNDGSYEDIKLVSSSDDKASKTIQAITKSDKEEIQNDYRSKSRELYYNN